MTPRRKAPNVSSREKFTEKSRPREKGAAAGPDLDSDSDTRSGSGFKADPIPFFTALPIFLKSAEKAEEELAVAKMGNLCKNVLCFFFISLFFCVIHGSRSLKSNDSGIQIFCSFFFGFSIDLIFLGLIFGF